MKTNLPKAYRPECYSYRKCNIGLDVPSTFYDNLKGIDENLYLVWHQYRLLWDTIINRDPGMIEDPRNVINVDYGHLNFGFVLTNGSGEPVLEQTQYDKEWRPHVFGAWHIWRLCKPAAGWAHVIKLDSTEGDYLSIILNRLHLQSRWTDRYGHRSYNKLLEEGTEKEKEQMMAHQQEMLKAFQTENKWFLSKAAANFQSGITKPSNPKREIITSFSGQGNRSKIVRPVNDKEAGLWTPDQG